MERSYVPQRSQQQHVLLGWTQQSVLPNEAVDAPSQSASSAVISPGSPITHDTLSEGSGQSSSSLKERDYIGLAEVSSVPTTCEPEVDVELNLAETDLRLGLGPISNASVVRADNALESFKIEAVDVPPSTVSHKPDAADTALHVRDDVTAPRSMPNAWQNMPTKSVAGAIPIAHMNGFPSAAAASASKNGGKRMYADAMINVAQDSRSIMNLNSSSGAANRCESRSCATQVMPIKQLQDSDKKSYTMLPQGVYWAPPHAPSWQPQANYRTVTGQKGMVFSSAGGEKNGEGTWKTKLDLTYRNDSSRVQSIANEENVNDDAPPAKGQVVGWPPVRSYRRSTLATRAKPTGDDGDCQSAIYVKVNMEGIPIGRKVDLNTYKSYDSLLSALEDMFHNPNSGLGARFLKGAEFVLTYEDKEGDWMLVGDLDWETFVSTVRRLRISRGSDMTGLGSRTSCHH